METKMLLLILLVFVIVANFIAHNLNLMARKARVINLLINADSSANQTEQLISYLKDLPLRMIRDLSEEIVVFYKIKIQAANLTQLDYLLSYPNTKIHSGAKLNFISKLIDRALISIGPAYLARMLVTHLSELSREFNPRPGEEIASRFVVRTYKLGLKINGEFCKALLNTQSSRKDRRNIQMAYRRARYFL